MFRPKPRANPLGKISIFRLFDLLVFITQKSIFFLKYRKTHFPGVYCRKRKRWKKGHFWTKTMETFGNISIFRLFKRVVFLAQKDVFLVLEYRKEHFSGLSWEKRAIFEPKPWVNPFGKISSFRLFELLVVMVQKVVFFFQNIVKHIFLAYIA